jgi:hypothetical protein
VHLLQSFRFLKQHGQASTSRISTRRKRLLNKSRVQSAGQISQAHRQAKGKQQQVESDGVDTAEKEKQPRTERAA